MGEWGQLYFFYLNNYIALIFFSITIKLESKFLADTKESKFHMVWATGRYIASQKCAASPNPCSRLYRDRTWAYSALGILPVAREMKKQLHSGRNTKTNKIIANSGWKHRCG